MKSNFFYFYLFIFHLKSYYNICHFFALATLVIVFGWWYYFWNKYDISNKNEYNVTLTVVLFLFWLSVKSCQCQYQYLKTDHLRKSQRKPRNFWWKTLSTFYFKIQNSFFIEFVLFHRSKKLKIRFKSYEMSILWIKTCRSNRRVN